MVLYKNAKKRKEFNRKQATTTKEKRVLNPNYGRSQKEIAAHKKAVEKREEKKQ